MKRIIPFLLAALLSAVGHTANYDVLTFGAVNNGKVITTMAIQKAIDECFKNGGGTVSVPPGEYLVSTLNLKSNVEFHLESGAILKAVTDLSKYQIHNEQPAGILYTENADNVSLTGYGTIHGQGMEFMYRDSAKIIKGDVNNYIRQRFDFRKVESGIGDGPLMPGDRYHQMIIFSNCTDVVIKDIRVIDAPYWTYLIVHCNQVWINGISINNNLLIPNSDGLDIISSSNVNVSNCIILCGDDALVLAGYAHHFGDPGFKDIIQPSQNINISNCILQSRSSGIRIGGWDQNQMLNYNFSNITIFDSNCGINLTVRDSGSIQHVSFSNIRIETRMHTGDWWGNGEPIKISALRGVAGNPIGIIRDIHFDNISCTGENSILLYASDETRLEDIYFSNFDFILRKSALEKVSGGNFDLRPNIVAGMEIFEHDIPIVYIENGVNIFFTGGTLEWEGTGPSYYTHALEALKVHNISLTNMIVSPSPSNPGLDAISLRDCVNVKMNLE